MVKPSETRNITFDPVPHTYTDETGKQYTSVTTLIHKHVNPFPTKFWAMYRVIDQARVYRPRPFPEQREIEILFQGARKRIPLEYFYKGIIPLNLSPETIRKGWEEDTQESLDWGNYRHDYLENCVNNFYKGKEKAKIDYIANYKNKGFKIRVRTIEELENSPLKASHPSIYKGLVDLINLGWTLYAEKRIYHSFYSIAGTIDILGVKGKSAVIVDWKTNKRELLFESGYYKKEWNEQRTKKIRTNQWIKTNQKMKFPLHNLPDINGYHYTLQLSLYAYLLECWGFTVKGLYLYHLRPVMNEKEEIQYEGEEDGLKIRLEHPPKRWPIKYLKEDIQMLLDYHIGALKETKPKFKIPSI
jgi:hypothetical protein